MKKRNHSSLIPWLDVFMNIAVVGLALFVISFAQMSQQSKKTEDGIMPKADFLITLDWDNKSDVDIDLWVRDPDGKLISWVNRTVAGMFLDRDDLGVRHDVIKLDDGSSTKIEINQEVVTIRGFKPGKYTVAAHYWRGNDPQKLSIQILKLQPFQHVFKKEGVEIATEGQEVTLVTFYVSKTGAVTSVNTDEDYFVNNRGG